MRAQKRVSLYITIGDPNGIGPEITLKALSRIPFADEMAVTVIGDRSVLAYYAEQLGISFESKEKDIVVSGRVFSLEDEMAFEPDPGRLSRKAGERSLQYLLKGVSMCRKNRAAALVTAPVSKEALWMAGFKFPGQTEFLSHSFNVKDTAMMLITGTLRVALATTHIPLKKVPDAISQDLIRMKCRVVHKDLKRRFGIKSPRIALAALNPHAGEHGKLGREEIEILLPAVEDLRKRGFNITGPISTDTLFTQKQIQQYDAVLTLYHDQGMLPVKMAGFGHAVNYTAGLPVVRTSPDHGTAFDIAGKGIAEESSMVEAIRFAFTLAKKENSYRKAV